MPQYLDDILKIVRDETGVDLSGYRQGTLVRRVRARRVELALSDTEAYLLLLRDDPSEAGRLLERLMINVSWFFREPLVFELLDRVVLPALLHGRRDEGTSSLRFWSAGSATGEEAYSLALLLHRALLHCGRMVNARIFGTDIDQAAVLAAARGRYPEDRLREVRLGHLKRYFVETDGAWEVSAELKNLVRFSVDDLTSRSTFSPAESVFGSFDLIMCRNVLIYFDPLLQQRVLGKLVRALAPGGYLVLGDAELPDEQTASVLVTVDPGCRIYRKLDVA